MFHTAPLRVAEGDHNKPVTVPVGADKLRAIGKPKGGGEGHAGWRALVEQYFPPSADAEPREEARYTIDEDKYAEEEIDMLRSHKDAELASVLRQNQAAAQASKRRAR